MGTKAAVLLVLSVFTAACSGESLIGSADGDDTSDGDTSIDDRPDVPGDTGLPDTGVVDVLDVVGDTPTWPCVPEFAARPRLILGGMTESTGSYGDPDRPSLFTLSSGQVWVASRIVSSPVGPDTPKLVYVQVDPMTANPAGPMYFPITHATLGAFHPTATFGDRLATVLPDPYGMFEGRMTCMLFDVPPVAPIPGMPIGLEGTETGSSRPVVAGGSAAVLAAWRLEILPGEILVDFGIVDSLGYVAIEGTLHHAGMDEEWPVDALFTGSAYGVLYVSGDVDGSGSATWNIAEVAEDGIVGRDLPGLLNVVGDPTFVWNGSEYGVLWEDESSLLFGLHSHGGGHGGSIHEDLKPVTGTLVEPQGMLDLVWTGDRYAAVWVHKDVILDRTMVWFFEFDGDTNVLNGPFLLNPDATETFHPRITWLETPTMRYYVFAWQEFSTISGTHVLYTYSYGCSI